MASNILGPVVGTAVYGCFGIDALCETAALTFAMSALLFGGTLKRYASFGMTGDSTTCSTCRSDFRESIRYLVQNASLLVVFFACGYFEPCVSWVNDWCSHCCFKASRNTVILCWDY